MVMGSEAEGGTQMHSVKKIDLMGQAKSWSINRRGHKPGNHIYQSTKIEGKRVVGEKTKGGSKPESQYDKHNRKTKPKQYTGWNKHWEEGVTKSKLKRATDIDEKQIQMQNLLDTGRDTGNRLDWNGDRKRETRTRPIIINTHKTRLG